MKKRLFRVTGVVFIGLLLMSGGLLYRAVAHEQANADLIAAIQRGDARAVALLVEQGADVNARDNGGKPIAPWQPLTRLFDGIRGKHTPCDARPTALQVALDIEEENPAIVQSLVTRGAKGQEFITPDDTAIFEVVLEAKYWPGPYTDILLSRTIKRDSKTILWDVKAYRSLDLSTRKMVKDYDLRNAHPLYLTHLRAKKPLRLVRPDVLKGIFAKGGSWTDFYKRFSGTDGNTEFSLPGYSADRNQAVVYYTHRAGRQSGEDDFLLMERVKGRWRIKKFLGGFQI